MTPIEFAEAMSQIDPKAFEREYLCHHLFFEPIRSTATEIRMLSDAADERVRQMRRYPGLSEFTFTEPRP